MSGTRSAVLLPAFFESRLLAVSRNCAALSSICHSLVASGSSHPKIRASQRMLEVLERNPITLHHSLRLRNSCGIRLG